MSMFLFLLCACSATLAVPTAEYYELEEAELHFERFIQEHNKVYADNDEKQIRFQIFKENLEHANLMNENSIHAQFGITRFMDLTMEEFVNMYTGLMPMFNVTSGECNALSDKDIPNVDVPEAFDWREHNAVTDIKDQLHCGSCYAFSSTGNIEGQYAIKHKKLIELSEQQIVDCDKKNNGCHGGLMTKAFASIMQLGGIQTKESYPYAGRQHRKCQFDQSQVAVKLTGCNFYSLQSQESLKRLVYSVGPIAVAVQAEAFHKYRNGIMDDNLCNVGDLNHAVLVVGYGTDLEKGIPYWIIKNSWSTVFGEEGYIKVQRGEDAHSCGVMEGEIVTAIVT